MPDSRVFTVALLKMQDVLDLTHFRLVSKYLQTFPRIVVPLSSSSPGSVLALVNS